MDLFEHSHKKEGAPLADRMRPTQLSEMVGQEHLLGAGKLLRSAIEADRVPSMVLWGPPGTGKTTLARAIAHETKARFETLSAVLSGVAELRAVVKQAREQKQLYGKRTLLFVDEIHRFNKSQQDALLPHVEDGTVILIGATTENPSFAINAALLSRARVFELMPLGEQEIATLLARALADTERGLGALGMHAGEATLTQIAHGAQGDARRALDVLETAARFGAARGDRELQTATVTEALAAGTLLHDKSGEGHYNVVSAFIKSMRGSDPDAALYWMMRMLEAGEDPLFVLRRMLIFASEDIGNADPRALQVAAAADQVFQRLGMPEGLHTLGQCCVYLASAPKSNASYLAWQEAQRDVRDHGALPVPLKLRNAPTRAMKEWGYGEGYRYPHDEGGHAAGETYLPEQLAGRRYYRPSEHGLEAAIGERLKKLRGSG
jgi:putative ATPase